MTTAAVHVRDLVKTYPGSPVTAVDSLSFEAAQGEVVGLLGPNGAGKTTTVGVLTTRVRATSGTAHVMGVDVARDPLGVRRLIAVVPQHVNLDRALDARQNLLFHAAYHGVPRRERGPLADRLLERVGLADQADGSVDRMSGGQSRRLLIARALMHRPSVLFLDEPTANLDPQARLFVHECVREVAAEGVCVVLTTHDMHEAAKVVDRVGVVDHGRMLTMDTPANLLRTLVGESTVTMEVEVAPDRVESLSEELGRVPGVTSVESVAAPMPAMPAGMPPAAMAMMAMMAGGGGPGGPGGPPSGTGGSTTYRLYLDVGPARVLTGVVEAVVRQGGTTRDLAMGTPSLEDVFIGLTGRQLR